MTINNHINKLVASVTLRNYAHADNALQKVIKEKLRTRFNAQYKAVEKQFFSK